MVFKRPFSTDTGEDSVLYVHCYTLPGDRAHWANMIVWLRRWSWKGHLLVTLGKRLCIFIIQVFQETRALWGNMIVFLERWSWNYCPFVTLQKWFCMFAVQFSLETELLKLVELHLRNGLEIVGHSAITLGDTLHSEWWFISWSQNVYFCVQLDKVPFLHGKS